MDIHSLGVFIGGVMVGAALGAFGGAAGFLYVLKTRYVIPNEEVQAELAEVLRQRGTVQ